MQLCDSAIAQKYSGMSGKGKGLTQVYAQIVGDRVVVKSSDETPAITFDRTPTQVSQLHVCANNDLVLLYFSPDIEEGYSCSRKEENCSLPTSRLPSKAGNICTQRSWPATAETTGDGVGYRTLLCNSK